MKKEYYTEKEKNIYYNNFIITPILWKYKKSKNIFDITYNVYFNNGSYFTNYVSYTLENVKKDLNKYM